MNFHFPFFHRAVSAEEHAAMRDRLIVAETKAMLLEDVVDHLRRPHREPRKDKTSIIEARRAKTEQLRRELGREA